MKKLLVLIFCLASTNLIKAQTEEPKYLKTVHLLKLSGYDGYAGWFLTLNFYINGKSESVSDTTFTILTNSAAYTQIMESFTLYTTKSKKELEEFVNNLDKKLKEIPKDASLTEGVYSFSKSKWLTILKTDTGRSDSWCYYAENISKKLHKALEGLK